MHIRPFPIPTLQRAALRLRRAAGRHRSFGPRRTALALTPFALAAAGLALTLAHPLASPAPAPSPAPALSSSAAACDPDAVLVNPCRPWLGAAASGYTQVSSSFRDQIEYHEQRIGDNIDIAHSYHSPTQSVPLAADVKGDDERYFVTRADTYMFINWKPAVPWSNAGGGNATINAKIDQAADNIAAVAPHKVFLTLHHEPENDVTGGASGCSASTYKPDAGGGTAADYRAMWQNVRTRFTTRGATNVVWVMDYMNYNRWDCMIDDLYPGNALVDWVMFNAYGNPGTPDIVANITRFQNLLASLDTTTTSFLSKPWGIVEWNFYKPIANGYQDPQIAYDYYRAAKQAVEANTFPRLKAYMVFDALGPDGNEHRILYDINNKPTDPIAQQIEDPQRTTEYAAFATSVLQAGTMPPDTTPPVCTITSPAWNATVSGIITIAADATDNVGVTRVEFIIDSDVIGEDRTAPYSFQWDTRTVSDGSHKVRAKAYDAAGNAKTPYVQVTVSQ